MIAILFQAAGFAAFFMFLLTIVRRGSEQRVCGWAALASCFYFVANVLIGNQLWVCIHGALGTWMAYGWWNSGGGDGTKRRLKSWARKFRGVRRTAPVMGGAS